MLGEALELEMSHLMSCFQMTGRFVTLGNGKIFHRIVRDPNDTGGQSAGITTEGHMYDNEFGIIQSSGPTPCGRDR